MKKLTIVMVLTGYLAVVLGGCGMPSDMQSTGEQISTQATSSSSVERYIDDSSQIDNGEDF